MTLTYQSAVLFVKDIAASRHFYETLLGQEVEGDFGLNIGFKGGFALWQNDHATMMIFERENTDGEALGRQNVELYFESDDLEAALTRLQQANVSIIHPAREFPWGQRAFRIYDPDGHIVEIGEPMGAAIKRFLDQGLTMDEVAQRTGMPLPAVQYVAEHGQLPAKPA